MFIFENTAYIEKSLTLSNDKVFPEKGWLVTHEGQRVDATYKGRKYTIIDKEILTLSWGQRLHQFLGLVLVVCSLGLAHLNASFRKHFEKTTCHFYLKKVEDLTVSFELPDNAECLPTIPKEIFKHILYLTDPASLIKSAPQVSKAWYNATNDSTLWKQRCTQPILGLKCWQDYFKNLNFDLSDLDEDLQKTFKEAFERIRQEPFLKSPEPPIPLFAYQYLEMKKDVFDLILIPNMYCIDLLAFNVFKNDWYTNKGHNMNNTRSQYFRRLGFSMPWKLEKSNSPCWMLISKEPLPESFNQSQFKQELLVKTYDPGLPFSLPTNISMTFYEALARDSTKERTYGTYAYIANNLGTIPWSRLVALDDGKLPMGSHATLMV